MGLLHSTHLSSTVRAFFVRSLSCLGTRRARETRIVSLRQSNCRRRPREVCSRDKAVPRSGWLFPRCPHPQCSASLLRKPLHTYCTSTQVAGHAKTHYPLSLATALDLPHRGSAGRPRGAVDSPLYLDRGSRRPSTTAWAWRMCITLALHAPEIAILAIIFISIFY
jgi:hypothetical protein